MIFATEYVVWQDRLRLNINGYFLKQVTDDKRTGRPSRAAGSRYSP